MDTRTGIRIALQVLGTYGFDGVTVSANDTMRAFGQILASHKASIPNKDTVLRELKRQKLIELNRPSETTYKFQLSLSGMYRLQSVLVDNIKIELPKKWDGKWRLVMFDIPLDSTNKRVTFTKHLSRLGLKLFRKGVWAYPYPCEQEIETIASYLNVHRHYTYIESTYMNKSSLEKLHKLFGV